MKQCPICSRTFPQQEVFCSVHGLPLIEALEMGEKSSGELTGQVLEERYRLGGTLGSGGMGVVYEAEQLRIGRRCAVKVLHGGKSAEAPIRMRFFREVRATARVHHPNVVEIIDFGETDDVGSYMVMEYLDGTSLATIISQEAPLPLPVASAIMIQLCDALSATHSQGLIHRDLKPSNVLRLPKGQIKVLDFGLVKPLDDKTYAGIPAVTTDNMIVGTPWYMSPEHCRGEVLDARADVYSLGVVLYEMLVGRLPFDGDHPLAVIEQQLNSSVPVPSRLDPPVSIPTSMELILLKALAKDRDGRYQSVHELSDAIFLVAEEQGFAIRETATRTSEVPEKKRSACRETVQWVDGPVPREERSASLIKLEELIRTKQEEMLDRVMEITLRSFPRYRGIGEAGLRLHVSKILAAAVDALSRDTGDWSSWDLDVRSLDAATERLSLTEVVSAIWLAHAVWRPIVLEAANMDLEAYSTLSDTLEKRLLPFYFHVFDRYIAAFQGRLQRLNESMARRNEELRSLRETLSEKVEQTSRQLAESERLKARVTESVSSAIILIERRTRRVLLWNKAMERLSGIPSGQVIGASIDEMSHHVDGIPFDEFAEQIAFHHEVGLRKLRMTFRGKEQRTVYVKGQPFYRSSGEHVGTLFVLEDVTEREQIIESLGRYLSRDLVSSILSKGSAQRPEGEQRRAVLLSVKLLNHRAAMFGRPQEHVVELLSRYVRSVAKAVFARGGTIERISPDGLTAYFARFGENAATAVEAAIELSHRLEQVNSEFDFDGEQTISMSAGLHIGDVLVANVGGKRLMVHTVVGEAAQTVASILDQAEAGEILLSPELAELVEPSVNLVPGRTVRVQGNPEPIQTKLVAPEEPFDLEPEPVTHITR